MPPLLTFSCHYSFINYLSAEDFSLLKNLGLCHLRNLCPLRYNSQWPKTKYESTNLGWFLFSKNCNLELEEAASFLSKLQTKFHNLLHKQTNCSIHIWILVKDWCNEVVIRLSIRWKINWFGDKKESMYLTWISKICIKYRKHWKRYVSFQLSGQIGLIWAVLKLPSKS